MPDPITVHVKRQVVVEGDIIIPQDVANVSLSYDPDDRQLRVCRQITDASGTIVREELVEVIDGVIEFKVL